MRGLVFVFLLSSVVHAGNINSAHRDAGRSYLEYKKLRLLDNQQVPTPSTVAVDFDETKLPEVPSWNSQGELMARFQLARDHRWMQTSDRPGFLRRASWLYPDDGCFARAQTIEYNLRNVGAPLPMKIFVFGNLAVRTPNAQDGIATWWYHVAPIIQVAGRKYVLDPSIEAHQPLPLLDWLTRMNNDPHSLSVAICGSGTYGPEDPCDSQSSTALERLAESDEGEYLFDEWQRLSSLGRYPELELGNQPPWSF